MMKCPRQVYSVDWMQLFCAVPSACPPVWESKVSPRADRYGYHRDYRIVPPSSYIKGYEWQRAVMWKNYTIATIACLPKDERHRRDGGAIKLHNAVLYVADWYFILTDVLATLGWQPLNITRVDLAVDFNYFLGGLLPDTFLRKYVCRQNASYLRIGSNKAAVYLIKDMRCTQFDSIRWGSRQNGVSVYMYNKTKELDEVKNKPWIREAWRKAQLSSTKPVWRVEVSITSQGLGLKDMGTHLIHNLFIDELMTPDLCRDMFRVYAAKYFRFVRTDPNAKRKRDLKEVPLLDVTTSSPLKPISLCESHDTGRMERIVSNKLGQLYDHLTECEFQDKYAKLKALKETIALYDAHHYIKSKARASMRAVEARTLDELSTALSVPRAEALMAQLNRYRQSSEEWRNLVEDVASEVIERQAHAHFSSPPPRAAARNGKTVQPNQ